MYVCVPDALKVFIRVKLSYKHIVVCYIKVHKNKSALLLIYIFMQAYSAGTTEIKNEHSVIMHTLACGYKPSFFFQGTQ